MVNDESPMWKKATEKMNMSSCGGGVMAWCEGCVLCNAYLLTVRAQVSGLGRLDPHLPSQ
jgi:hypothetical protein